MCDHSLPQLPGLKGTEGGWVLVGLSPTVTTGVTVPDQKLSCCRNSGTTLLIHDLNAGAVFHLLPSKQLWRSDPEGGLEMALKR